MTVQSPPEKKKSLLARPMLAKGGGKISHVAAPIEELAPERGLADRLPVDWPTSTIERGCGLSPSCDFLSKLLPAGMSLRLLGEAPNDREALFKHWLSLGPQGMRTRFFYAPSEDLLERRAIGLSFENPRLAGIFDEHGILVCVGEWAREPGEEREAEAAFSTSPSHQRRGFAKIIAAACVLDARERGSLMLRIDTLRENIAAQALAASLGGERARPSGSWDDTVSSRISLSEATPSAVMIRMDRPARQAAGRSLPS